MQFRLFFGLALFHGAAQGLKSAIPWELLHYYDAYKAEWAAIPLGSRTIATNCKHKSYSLDYSQAYDEDVTQKGLFYTVTNGGKVMICSFDEFVKHIASNQWGRSYKADARGTTLNPLASDVVDKITSLNAYQNDAIKMLYKPTAMLDKVTWTDQEKASPKNIPLARVQQYFFNAFQVSRAAAATSTNEVVKEIVDAAVANSKEALRITNMYRLKDRNEKWLIPQLTHVPNAKGDLLPEVPEMEPFASSFTTDTTDILSVDGTTKLDDYEELNWGTTFAGAEGSTEEQRTAMETWSSQYHTQNAITKVHQDVLDMNTWGIGLLNGESFDCPHGPADSVGEWPPPPVASPPVAPVVPPAPAKFKRYLTEKTPGFRAAFAEHMKRHTRMAGRSTK